MYRKNLITDAAKAAKIDYYATDEDGSKCTNNGKWNPITDDADCAQLEMICELDLDWRRDLVRSGGCLEFYSDHDGDKQAARRLASTRAAASICE
jgi:hypothetical protein